MLTEFHPRSVHFPPRDDDDDDILAPAEEEVTSRYSANEKVQELTYGGESTFAGWSEPAQRSDRIIWSLIGTTYTLAYELGIFGTYSDGVQWTDGKLRRNMNEPPELRQRADRIERLLYIYITQASGRFGLPSMYSDHVNNFSLSTLKDGFVSAESEFPQDPVDKTQNSWVELMSIMKACNDELFPNKEQTYKLIRSGEYMGRIIELQPFLHSWYQRLENLNLPKYSKVILSIDYHYIKLYINSLALQAVLEQWATKVNALPQGNSPQSPESTISSSFASLYSRNEPHIREVINSSRTVLRHGVEDLLPDDHLKHVPVRTYFRITSASTFLLKTFALGGKQDDVEISMRLLDQTINALRTSVVDDVHLSLRIADLLERLTSSIRHKFVRLAPRSNPETADQIKEDHGQMYSPLYVPDAALRRPTGSRAHIRYLKQPYTEDGGQNNNTFGNPPYDHQNPTNTSNITIMPPLGDNYSSIAYPLGNPMGSTSFPYDQQQQQQQQQSSYPLNQGTSAANIAVPNEENWLTLDLQPLLDPSGLGGGGGDNDNNVNNNINPWFGAFGPETHNNLEVLGKLVDDEQFQFRTDGYDAVGDMTF